MDSSEFPVRGTQEGTCYNDHFRHLLTRPELSVTDFETGLCSIAGQ